MGELQNIGNYSETFQYLREQVIYFENTNKCLILNNNLSKSTALVISLTSILLFYIFINPSPNAVKKYLEVPILLIIEMSLTSFNAPGL